MKRKLLFAAIFIAGVLGMRAQTDVTSTYLTNADFEGDASVYQTLGQGGKIYNPSGWTIAYSNPQEWDCTALNSSDGKWSNFSGKPQPANGEANVYWIRFRWGNNESLALSQTIVLPSGLYCFSADAFFNGASGGIATISAGGQSVNIVGCSTWNNYTIPFNVESETSVTITISLQQTKQVENIAGFDNCKLVRLDTDVTSTYISNAGFETDAAAGSLASAQTNPTGWTLTSSGGTGNTQWGTANASTTIQGLATSETPSAGSNYFYLRCNWQNGTTLSVTNNSTSPLIAGKYLLVFDAFTYSSNATQPTYTTTFAGESIGMANSSQSWKTYSISFTNWKEATKSIVSAMKPGAADGGKHDWMLLDNFRLYYTEEGLEDMYATALADANAAIKDESYVNITGTEKTSLQSAIDASPTGRYAAAINDLINTTETFIAAKANYDALVAEIAQAKALGVADATAESYAATSSSTATSVLTNIQDLKAAEFTYITTEKPLVADITLLLTNPSFETGDAWTNGWTTARNTTGSFDYKYVATSGETADEGLLDGTNVLNAWAPQINYINVTQSVNLPAGHYRLTASVFSDKIKNQHIAAIAGGETYNSAVLDGANWQTLSVDFYVPTAGDVTLGIYSNGNNVNGDTYGWFKADNFKLYYLGDAAANMKIAAGKYGTFIAPFDVMIPDGVTASKVTGVSGSELELEDVTTTIPANTPVVVASASAVDETFYERSTANEDSYTAGLLTGVYTATSIAASTETVKNYVLQTQDEKQAFYLVDTDFTATPNRAYLTLNTASAPKRLEFGTHSSAINGVAIEDELSKGTIYNVAGQRMQSLQKGINIVNGKKVFVK